MVSEDEERKDEQQALLLSALRRAAGAPVSYAELRNAGVEFPAGVVSELELEGVPLQRCRVGAGGGPGVRLLADLPLPTEPPPGSTVASDDRMTLTQKRAKPTSGWTDVRVYRVSFFGIPRPGRRLLVPLLVVAVIGIVTVLVLAGREAAGRSTSAAATHTPRPAAVPSTSTPSARAASPGRPARGTPPTPVSPVLATELEARGHGLLAAGRYGNAVRVLNRAVLATGKSLAACAEPAGSACLTYAYALYDLGRALRLSGHPAAAVPVLKRRLRIDNQRPIVEAQLRLADQGIG